MASSFVFTRHSQTTQVPDCPAGYHQLWDGYSLLHTEDDGRAHIQDLGEAILALNTSRVQDPRQAILALNTSRVQDPRHVDCGASWDQS